MKGILLAGGKGTRLYPITSGISKQLLPVYDKPLIYYPLSVLMLAGIREILIITTPADLHLFRRLLQDGSQWGLRFEYAEQVEPRGIAEAFIIGRQFIERPQLRSPNFNPCLPTSKIPNPLPSPICNLQDLSLKSPAPSPNSHLQSPRPQSPVSSLNPQPSRVASKSDEGGTLNSQLRSPNSDLPFPNPSSVCLILGDNIFFGTNLLEKLQAASRLTSGATVFAYQVRNPERYGVVEFDDSGKALSLEEKPRQPKSNFAVPGLYFYDSQVTKIAANLQPSCRGELEITDLNQIYLNRGQLRVDTLGRGTAWLDAGTPESLLQATQFVQTVQDRQGLMISCPEEIAYRKGFITAGQLMLLAQEFPNAYGQYLQRLVG